MQSKTSSEQTNGAIAVHRVTKIFGGDKTAIVALDDVSLVIQENEFFTLLGPSGCGKTTLLRLIAGFEHPGAGNILLYGENILGIPPFKRPVNTVFQNYALFPHMTVAENIGFGLEMLGQSKQQVSETTQKMLALVRMQDLSNRHSSQISGGQQQRVALARALAPQPKVLLLDEPLSALDFKLRKDMQLELKRLQHETGITFVFVTHDQEEALTMSDRVAVMNAGRILQIGSPRDIYDHPAERFVADFVGDTNFMSATIESVQNESATVRFEAGDCIDVKLPRMLNNKKQGDKLSLAIRPEHAVLTRDTTHARLAGTLENVVYFGTDTRYHIRLGDNSDFVVRKQNDPQNHVDYNVGEKIGISFRGDVVQALKD
ncbi:MAG: ABC transporter ATP-binding protein [Arenicellales bacterium WSBS_2016_MAG_OTU3]